MELFVLACGDPVYRYQNAIVIQFKGKRRLLSTSLYNGGVHEDFTFAYNHYVYGNQRVNANPASKSHGMTMNEYVQHMRHLAEELGFDPDKGTGLGTAAYMEHVAIVEESHEMLTVTAIVTGGIETNGGRVGDPASYFQAIEKTTHTEIERTRGVAIKEASSQAEPAGTINIMLHIDGDLEPSVLARALVTCTEAKTAALQELMASSKYSMGIATGSGTDQTVVICNSDSPYVYDSAGKHNKVGELIGRVVMRAVKQALHKQNRLCPYRQYQAFNRLDRFGITKEGIYESYKGTLPKCECMGRLETWAALPTTMRCIVTAVHAMDEYEWQLISEDDVWHIFEDFCGIQKPSGEKYEAPRLIQDIRSRAFKAERTSTWTIDGHSPTDKAYRHERMLIFREALSQWILEKALL